MLHAGKISSYVKPVLNNQGLAFKQYVNYITASYHTIRILDTFCAAAKIVLDIASVHTQGRFWRRDFFDELKLRRADLEVELHISDSWFCAILWCRV